MSHLDPPVTNTLGHTGVLGSPMANVLDLAATEPDAEASVATAPPAGMTPAGAAVGRSLLDGLASAAPVAAAQVQTPPSRPPLAFPADMPPDRPPQGTVYQSTRPVDGQPVGRGLGHLSALRIGWHTASHRALATLRTPASTSGVILGFDRNRQPVAVRMFRAEPTQVTLVGGTWAGKLLALRSLALGVSTVVLTDEPANWQHFGTIATGQADRVVVLRGEQPVHAFATAWQPALIIYDLGQVGPAAPVALASWQTRLTVLRQLSESGMPFADDCRLLMTQRLTPDEAARVGAALRLPSRRTQQLQQLPDDVVALVGQHRDRLVGIEPTAVELHLLGHPSR